MAPEALLDSTFTPKTDVWAFAITIWEIVSLGRLPYVGLSNQGQLLKLAGLGKHLLTTALCLHPIRLGVYPVGVLHAEVGGQTKANLIRKTNLF